MNAIMVINPYRWNNLWVFDDESKELDKEPLIAGADTLLSALTNNGEKCTIMFSGNEFPDAQFNITKKGPGMGGGTDYYSKAHDHDLWLCPALLKYFDTPPSNIYVKLVDND